ncbi:Uncharacterized conserved protein, DUF2252 family [Mucilaginibacter lappiensis]|uniref:Uncharacterized protein (DUF2252 family) n=1 Tax=Mucilaginibacter lappiensis TaxID=354630 RepID=A0ABR6PFD0_9SPHI|nr:DUF2252 family protein [Mucilaginibacter lappiensis]MBB6107730.1 uncharacterized protein (DUF2252 family) [Mucilaginibacter lappiensis]SIP98930.1 Uncharacterized conserved protein, DUF2252 family [Mucilaginibacter lappiensis]
MLPKKTKGGSPAAETPNPDNMDLIELFERLIAFNAGLLPDMLELKYEGMAESAFRFFRGTCHLFYEDLAHATPLPLSPLAWICGDLHIENFGSYRGDNKLVYFDLNDFDEALLAPASYELVRMVTSIFIAFDQVKIGPRKARRMAELYLRSYSATLELGKAKSIEPRTARGIVCDFLKKAEKSTYKDLLRKRTINDRKKRIFSLEDERHFKLDKKLQAELAAHIQEWISTSSDGPYNYKVKSVVFRLAGTGSIGLKRYLFLLKSTNTRQHYLMLDMKQCRAASPLPHVAVQQLQWESDAERVTSIQRRMQNVSAALLSTTSFRGESFLIQELQPVKDTIKFKLLKDDYRGMYQVIDDMGVLTASSQLRSGGLQGSSNIDDLIAFGRSTEWQAPLLEYALAYAEQVKRYYKRYVKEYKDGKLA